jgi:lipoprotein-anchoring transpeptidase ErfK/SrfK
MLRRMILGLALASGALATSGLAASAQGLFGTDERFTMGQPSGGLFGMSSSASPVPREVVMLSPRQSMAAGTIVISTSQRRLYYMLGNGQAIRYGIGVGRDGFTWRGVKTVSAKKEWPDWTPPAQMLRRRPDLPRFMKGGPDNPLGARAMYLGSTLYRIHGSNEPETIGTAVSSGCFRLTNEDVIDLYNRVRVGAKVIVM